MKHSIKHYLKLGILLFTLLPLSLFNCKQDDDYHIINKTNHSQKSNIIIKTLSKKEVFTNKIIKEKVKKLQSELTPNKNIASRDIYNFQYNFTINTEHVNYIETESLHSYTFAIYKANSETLDNLVLVYNGENYYAYIVSYSITAQEQTNLQAGIPINLDDKVEITEIDGILS